MGLTIEGLTLSLGGREVLSDIAATLVPGRVTAILGPNGAGKTSLLRCIAGIAKPERGTITIDGEDVGLMELRARARRIGYLPQSTESAWNIPAREIVALGRHAWRAPFAALSADDHAAIDAAMAGTDTAQFATRLVQELSGGERARVMLARVLAGDPQWLLADEPLASLDPAHQFDVLDRLKDAARDGRGVVIVLHDLAHAARIADDVVLLRQGKVHGQGPCRDILTASAIAEVFGIAAEILDLGDGGFRIHLTGRSSQSHSRL